MKTHYSILIALLSSQIAHAVVLDNAETETTPAKALAASVIQGKPSSASAEVMLGLNFRGTPIQQVLEYIADMAGLIIVSEAPVSGKVDVWSNEKISIEDGIALLNTVLAKNGLAALRNGRILTIVTSEEAKKRDIPLKIGAEPESIPKNTDIVTQIIPLKGINAAQLARDLSTLVPGGANFIANEGANSILMTDTQVHIRRMAEIIAALDTEVSSAASIRVFPMKYADSKAIATVVKDLFQDGVTAGAGNNTGGGAGQNVPGGGFGGGPGGRGPGGGIGGFGAAQGNNNSSQGGNVPSSKLIAVSDEHSNSLIVKGSESQLTQVAKLLVSLDKDIKDMTELRVFHLINADPTEMSEVLAGMFPDTSSQDDVRGGGFTFAGGPGGNSGLTFAANAGATSEHALKQSKVSSFPDTRTRSLVVSASSILMPQIAGVIGGLDSSARGKKKVAMFKINQGSTQNIETVLRGLFSSQTTSSTTATDALGSRETQAAQNQASTSTSSGSGSGLGSGSTGR